MRTTAFQTGRTSWSIRLLFVGLALIVAALVMPTQAWAKVQQPLDPSDIPTSVTDKPLCQHTVKGCPAGPGLPGNGGGPVDDPPPPDDDEPEKPGDPGDTPDRPVKATPTYTG